MEPLEEGKETDEKKAVCRICLSFDCDKSSPGLSLFEKYNNVYVYEKVNYIASIEIKKDDNLPDRICSTCLLALDNACEFKQQCESSDAILHSPLQFGEALHEQFVEPPVKEEYEFDYLEDNSPFPQEIDSKLEGSDPIKHESGKIPFISKAIDLKLECHDCGNIFKSKCKLRVHWKKVHMQQQLICPICKKSHKTYKSYHNHLKRKSKACLVAAKMRVEGVGKSRVFHCKECDVKSPRIHAIMTHLVIHSGERPYACDICGKTFTQISSLIGHKESKHKENVKEATCHLCGKHIKGRNNFYRHMKRHTDVQIPCTVCNKMFSSAVGLRIHMKRHSGVKSYTCELCAKTFYVSSDLRNHKVKTHYKNKIYDCPACDYKTHNHAMISKHRKRHTGINVACDVCGTFVDNQQQLVLHKKRHFEKNFKCSICDKKYFARKHLQSHVRKVHNLYKVGTANNKNTTKVDVKRNSQSV